MGKILTGYKSAVINDIINGNTNYYVFAANPTSVPSPQTVTTDDYSSLFLENWQMMFGKRVKTTDIKPVIRNVQWVSGVTFQRYDNTKETTASNYYTVTPPATVGGYYKVYKCIDNNGNAVSTAIPDVIDPKSFTKTEDGYTWRYITSISSADYVKFATSNFIPIYPNTTIQSTALQYSSIDVVVVANAGSGYSSYHNGVIQGVVPEDSTTFQIETSASIDQDFYVGNGIYFYDPNSSIADLRAVVRNYTKADGSKWVVLDSGIDSSRIVLGSTRYIISPKVVFKTNGTTQPKAYTVVNTSSNSIGKVVVVDPGNYITWANVSIQSNSIFGSGANVYAIVPPPGGHGANPSEELKVKGFCISTTFANNESTTIPTEVLYNKVGVFANPYEIDSVTGDKVATLYTTNTFSSLVKLTPLNNQVFNVGEIVKGTTSNTYGVVAFSNSSVVMLAGDKTYANAEYILSDDGERTAQVSINTLGDIYTKDIRPIYIQNIADVQRSNTQSESFKLVIQI